MKKLFSLVTILFALFVLTACQDDAESMKSATISAFLDNHAADYIETPQREAVMALAHLDELDGFTPPEDDPADMDVNGIVDAIILRHIAHETSDGLYAALEEEAGLVHPYPDALVQIVFSMRGEASDNGFSTVWVDDLRSRDLAGLDPDTLSMVLLALTHENAPAGVEDLRDEVLELLSANVYENEYGLNAAGVGMAIMALLATGTDPRDETFVHEDKHLLDHLLVFANEDGSFDYQDEPDLLFSTPQAVLALVMMQKFIDGTDEPHPFELP